MIRNVRNGPCSDLSMSNGPISPFHEKETQLLVTVSDFMNKGIDKLGVSCEISTCIFIVYVTLFYFV